MPDAPPTPASRPSAHRSRLAARTAQWWPVAARALAIGMTFAFSLVVGRVLGTESAGAVFTAVVLVTLLSTAGRLGVDLDAMKRAARLHDRDGLTADALGWSRLLRVCVAGSLAAASLAIPIGLLDRSGNAVALLLFALSVPGQAVSVLAAAVLRGGGRAGAGALVEVGLAQGLAALGVVALGAGGPVSLVACAATFLVAQSGVALLALILVRTVWTAQPAAAGPAPSPARRPELFSMMASSLLFYLLTWSPLLVVAVLGTPHDASVYGAAARFPTAVAIIPTVLLSAALPRLIASYAHGRTAAGNDELARINRLAAVAAAGISIPLLVAAPWVMGLFGPGFDDGAWTLRILAAGQLVAVLLGPTALLPPVLGMEREAQWTLLAVCAASLVLGAALVPAWGAGGAAVGWLVAVLSYGLAMAVRLRRRAGVISPLTVR